MSTSPSDRGDRSFDALLEQARSGSKEALGVLLEDVRKVLARRARRLLRQRLQTKAWPSDLVQQTFLEVHQDIQHFQGKSAEEFLAWLFRVLSNNILNLERQYAPGTKRDVRREVPLERLPVPDRTGPGPDRSAASPVRGADRDEDAAAYHRAVEQLPREYRQVVHLRTEENCSFKEIGSRLGRSAEAARKLWHRAVQHLRALCGRGGAPGPRLFPRTSPRPAPPTRSGAR